MPLTKTDVIQVFSPHLGVDTLKAVTDAFNVGWIGMGATTLEFERALQDYLGGERHVVATMTGSDALHLGLLLAGVSKGDEVILPSFNFIADVQAILWCGAEPVFCDIDPHTLAIDPIRVAELITPRTKAIMPLHFAGVVGDLDTIYEIANQHHLRVIEDATHALGSSFCNRRIGSFGDITCFSFDPVKIITSLDGGAVVTRSEEDIAALHRMRLLGIDKDTSERYRNRRAWDYDVLDIGFRSHMTNINAAIGLSQLKLLDEFVARRQETCRRYDQEFEHLEWLSVTPAEYARVSPFIYTVRVLQGERDRFMTHLRHQGVETGIHFMPCHSKSLCREMTRGPMLVTDQVSQQIVTLPLWSDMPDRVVERIIDSVLTFQPSTVSI